MTQPPKPPPQPKPQPQPGPRPTPHPVDPRPPWHRPGKRTEVVRVPGFVDYAGCRPGEIAAMAAPLTPSEASLIRRLLPPVREVAA